MPSPRIYLNMVIKKEKSVVCMLTSLFNKICLQVRYGTMGMGYGRFGAGFN